MPIHSAFLLCEHPLPAIKKDMAIYWQESNCTTWKLARMNPAIRGIDANLGPRNADSYRQHLYPDLKADFILAQHSRWTDASLSASRLKKLNNLLFKDLGRLHSSPLLFPRYS